MAGFIFSQFTVRFRVFYDNQGQPAENHFHVHRSGVNWPAGEMDTWCVKILTHWTTYLRPYTTSDVGITKVEAVNLTTAFSEKLIHTTGLPIYGTSGYSSQPQNVTMCVSWHTGGRGKSFNGRTYHVGLPQNVAFQGELHNSDRIDLEAAWGALIPALNDGLHQFIVLSYVQNGIHLSEAARYPITNCTIDPYLDSQKRRLPQH